MSGKYASLVLISLVSLLLLLGIVAPQAWFSGSVLSESTISAGQSIPIKGTLENRGSALLPSGELVLALVDSANGDIAAEKRVSLASLSGKEARELTLSLDAPESIASGEYEVMLFASGAGEPLSGDIYTQAGSPLSGKITISGGSGKISIGAKGITVNGYDLGWTDQSELSVSVPVKGASADASVSQQVFYASEWRHAKAKQLVESGTIALDSPLAKKIEAAEKAAQKAKVEKGAAKFSLNLPEGEYVLKYSISEGGETRVAYRKLVVNQTARLGESKVSSEGGKQAIVVFVDPSYETKIIGNGEKTAGTKDETEGTVSFGTDFSAPPFSYVILALKKGAVEEADVYEYSQYIPTKPDAGIPAKLAVDASLSNGAITYQVLVSDKYGDFADGQIRVIVSDGNELVYSSAQIKARGKLDGATLVSDAGNYTVSAYEDTQSLSAKKVVEVAVAPSNGGSASGGAGGSGGQNQPLQLPVDGIWLVVLTLLVIGGMVVAWMVWKRRRKRRG